MSQVEDAKLIFFKNLKARIHCEASHEIQLQEHFMKHEMLS